MRALFTMFFVSSVFVSLKAERDTRYNKSLQHIAATSHLVCTAGVASHCDKTLVQCTQVNLEEGKCELVQI